MSDDSITREGTDIFGDYTEERTGRGWRKLRRRIGEYEFKVHDPKTEDYIKAMLASGVELRLNDMSDRIELATGKPLSDFQLAAILNRLRDLDMRDTARMRDAVMEAALRCRYHPVREYLDGLRWDGRNHFDALASCLTMSSPGATVFLRKFLIGSIAKMLDAQQNFMLVLLGPQGKGKSRLVEWLCPLPGLFYEGPINPDDKDFQIRLLNNWLWEVAELDATTKRAERSALKHFITTRMVKVRVPFGKYDIEKPAAASMIGTINPDGTGFLNDPTGNRRFVVIHLESIDFRYSTTIDVHQLWAELYAAYRNGEPWELTPHEQEVQNDINGGHMISTPLEELLLQYFEIDPTETHFTPTMEILAKLETMGLRGDQFRNKMELTSILTKMGMKPVQKRIGQQRQRGYEGVWFKGEHTKEVSF